MVGKKRRKAPSSFEVGRTRDRRDRGEAEEASRSHVERAVKCLLQSDLIFPSSNPEIYMLNVPNKVAYSRSNMSSQISYPGQMCQTK